MSSSPGEEFGGLIAIVVGLALVVAVGVVVLPFALAGVGGIYYWRNVLRPKQRERELQERTNVLHREAEQITPVEAQLYERLTKEGIIDEELREVAYELYFMEGLKPPEKPPALSDTIQGARYRDRLLEYMEHARPGHFEEFIVTLVTILRPLQSTKSDGTFHSRVPRTPKQIDELILAFFRGPDECFKKLCGALNQNFKEQKEVRPEQYTGKNCAWDYLKDTPLLKLEYIEQAVSLSNRTYHTHILGASGSGKSNLIEYLISRDISGDEDNCVIVIDSQVQMIPKLANIQLDTEGVTYINPAWNLALNLFDVGYEDMKKMGVEGERLMNTTVSLISFVLEAMMDTQLSDPQKTIFEYAIQLVVTIPKGNIYTFFDLLADDGHLAYSEQIKNFDDNTQAFFFRDFGSPDYKRSRDAIRRRLQSMLRNPTFRRLFSATENKVDMYQEMKNRKLILVDTNLPMLGKDASAFFGRLFIALIVQASHRRFNNKDGKYKPVYLYVDEAHEYFDNKISEMLEQARKANIGLIVAHQSISQTRSEQKNIIDPLMVNTATKFVATGYSKDASVMAGSMHTTASDIMALPQYTFGYYARDTGFTQIRAVPNPLNNLAPRYDDTELKIIMEARLGSTTSPPERDIDGENTSPGEPFEAREPDNSDLGTVEPI